VSPRGAGPSREAYTGPEREWNGGGAVPPSSTAGWKVVGMPVTITERFIEALQAAERTRQVDDLVDLFVDDAEATSLARTEPLSGRHGVRQFWQDYLHAFDEIHSEFTNIIENDQGSVLEWVSRGTLAGGQPVAYRGVSVLETDGRLIQRFRTYYDSAVFLPQGAKHEAEARR
jgi:ketosteroid isomerase-like protein